MVVLGNYETGPASSEMAAPSPSNDDLIKSFDEWLDTVDPRMKECIQGQLKQLEEQARAIENFTALADDLSAKFHDLCERHDHQRSDENSCQPPKCAQDQLSQCLPGPNPCEFEESAFRVNRSLRRVWEVYAESVGYEPTALEHFSPDVHVKFQEYSASTRSRSDRALLRFNGGWEHMLKTVLGVNFSESISAFASPSSQFSAFSRECLEVGASPLSHVELLAEGIGGTPTGVTPGFFIRTDMFPTPQASFFEVVHDAIMSDAPFRLVVASCCGASAAWGSWLDQWCQQGRAHLLARLPTLKMRRYGGMREQSVWDEFSWEFFVIELGSAAVGASISPCDIEQSVPLVVRKAKGEFFPFPLPTSGCTHAARGRGSRHDGFTQTEVDEFWLKRDQLAKQRQDLFDKGNVDWSQIARLLTASNLLMPRLYNLLYLWAAPAIHRTVWCHQWTTPPIRTFLRAL